MLRPKHLLALGLTLASCTRSPQKPIVYQSGHLRLYSQPELQDHFQPQKNIKRLVVVGTNDFHGNLEEVYETSTETAPKKSSNIKIGGAATIASYFNILKKKYKNQLILVDAGNALEGSPLSHSTDAKPVLDFYQRLGYKAMTLGAHDFDLNKENENNLKKIVRRSKVPFIATNIVDLKRQSLINWKGVRPYLLTRVNGVKVGILGVSGQHTPELVSFNSIRGLYFDKVNTSVLKYSKILRRKGAKVIILLANTSTVCGIEESLKHNIPIEKTNFKADKNICHSNTELVNALQKIPKGTVDVVVASQSKGKIANSINGIPVIQSFSHGKYFGRVELFYDQNNDQLLKDKTIIHQPIKFCQEFFEQSNDCYANDPSIDHEKRIVASFLGEEIKPKKQYQKIINKYRFKKDNRVLGFIPKKIEHTHLQESTFANYVVDNLREEAAADFSLIDSSLIKQGISSGHLTGHDLQKSIPSDEPLIVINIKGSYLKEILKRGLSKPHLGRLYFSGHRILLTKNKFKYVKSDWNENGKIESWENTNIIDVQLQNGAPIEKDRVYSVITTDSFIKKMPLFSSMILKEIKDHKIKTTDYKLRSLISSVIEKEIKNFDKKEKSAFNLQKQSRILYVD